jgi:tellurite resistance protein TerC
MSDDHILEIFIAGVVGLLAVDMVLQSRNRRPMSWGRAAVLTGFWLGLSILFGGYVWKSHGETKGLEFFTGFVIEYALSVDNLFVFVAVFGFFQVKLEHQQRVLLWGVLGAILLRAVMIVAGVALVERFEWMFYLFGAFMIFTGIRMLGHRQHLTADLQENRLLKLVRQVLPVAPGEHGQHFLVHHSGRWMFTSLAVVLVVVEATDVVFALDSIPAVFAVTQDRFIIFTSNICAILGLRSLYFLLAGGMQRFTYLSVGLAFILIYVGVKMLVKPWFDPPLLLSLGVIVGALGISMLASNARKKQKT